MTLTIEKGKFYRDEDDNTVGPMEANGGNAYLDYKFRGMVGRTGLTRLYNEKGEHWGRLANLVIECDMPTPITFELNAGGFTASQIDPDFMVDGTSINTVTPSTSSAPYVPSTTIGFYPTGIPVDMVNNPSHYGGKDNVYEVVKVIRAWKMNFSLGNAVKYIARAGKKNPDKTIEDLEKAVYYIQEEIASLKKEKND